MKTGMLLLGQECEDHSEEVFNVTETILDLEEVAKMLKVSERTVQREVTAGKLRAFRVGRSLRFRLTDVEKYMERQEVSPGDSIEPGESR